MSDTDADRRTVLLVSNRRLDENAGRAAKFEARSEFLRNRGWNLTVGYVDPTLPGTIAGTVRCLRGIGGVDVVNSVSNPPHLQMVGGVLARLTGTPWVAEFRDPLLANPDVDPDSMAGSIRRRLERYILAHADTVVWYDGIQIPDGYFETEYGDVDATVRKLPPIGFRKEKFDAVDPTPTDGFTVTYAGSFYEGWIEPYTFLRGLAAFAETAGDRVDGLTAQFYGDWNDDYQAAAEEAGVVDHVESHPFVDHETIIGVMKGSDALLYVGGDDPRNRRNIPSKLYDYIGAGRPIVAIVDPTFRVAEIIEEHGFGIVVEPDDGDGVASALGRIESGAFEYAPDPEDVAAFGRHNSAEAYLDTLESVVETP